jgi:hypothetical protein
LLLRRKILSTLLLLEPADTNKTPLAVAVDELAVVVEADDHKIIKTGHGISRGHILLGFHSGSHGPLLLALILPSVIYSN